MRYEVEAGFSCLIANKQAEIFTETKRSSDAAINKAERPLVGISVGFRQRVFNSSLTGIRVLKKLDQTSFDWCVLSLVRARKSRDSIEATETFIIDAISL